MIEIIQSLGAIGDGLISIVDYLGKRLLEGIKIIAYMLEAVSQTENYLTWAPVSIASIISLIVGIAVIYRILGWGD